MMTKIDYKSLTLGELKTLLGEMGQPAFRAGQVYSWLHQKQVTSFEEMTNLPQALRDRLAQEGYITVHKVARKLVSKLDGTQKFLFQLRDGNCIETVLMKYKHGNSLCISSQVGCRMGCNFCASTLGGLVRNLTPSEMLEEVYAAQRESGEKVASIVLMGIGEPLDNFDNVMQFLEILSSPEGMNLSLRHVSLSTCGLVDGIYKLMEKKLQLTLSISLHAPNDEIRNRTMPVNKKYNVAELMNLIPVNPVKERGYQRGSRESIARFQQQLEKLGINATVRRELGSDINAACGQLRRAAEQEAQQR